MPSLPERIADAFLRLWEAFVSLVPAFLVLLACLLVGIGVGALIRATLRLALREGKPASGGTVQGLLRASGIRSGPAQVAATVSFWGTVVVALGLGVTALEPGGLRDLLGKAFAFLPLLLTAALFVVLGAGAAEIARRSILLTAVNAGLPWARNAARLAHLVVLGLSVAAALDHVGVARSILVAAFSIAGGGVVLALALAFGLGAKDLARAYLEKKLRAEEEDSGIRHV